MTQKDSMSRLMVEPVEAFRVSRSEVRVVLSLRRDQDRIIVEKHVNPRWREKLLTYGVGARTANRRRWARRES